jgi:hypothetical protein
LSFNNYLSVDLCKNSTPSALIMCAFSFSDMPFSQKHEYLQTLGRSKVSDQLHKFCLSFIDKDDPVGSLYRNYNESSDLYTIEPYKKPSDFIAATRDKYLHGNQLPTPLEALLKFDFIEFVRFGVFEKYSKRYLSLGDALTDLANISLSIEEQYLEAVSSDFMLSLFFSVIDLSNSAPIVKQRAINITEYGEHNISSKPLCLVCSSSKQAGTE